MVSIDTYWIVVASMLIVWVCALIAIYCDYRGWSQGFKQGCKIWREHSEWLEQQLRDAYKKRV